MRRVALIVGTFLVLAGAAGVVTYRDGGKAARGMGLAMYQHRHTAIAPLRALRATPPVVWVGDSTIMAVGEYPSYVPMVQAQLRAPARVPSFSLEGAGMDFYAYWSLAGRIAALRPTLVVLIANLRNFAAEGGVPGFNDLTAEIGLADLPRTLALPYYMRGMTAPRLLLARALRTELGEDLFLTFEGARRNVQDARAWDVLGPAARPEVPGELFTRFMAMTDRIQAEFDRPFGRDSPVVRYVGATVSRLAREGITVLVVVTPFPWELAVPKHYDEGRFRARIGMLRSVVEERGGRLVDLHRALPKQFFRDTDCHFTAAGAAEMAKLVTPEVRRLLFPHDRARRRPGRLAERRAAGAEPAAAAARRCPRVAAMWPVIVENFRRVTPRSQGRADWS